MSSIVITLFLALSLSLFLSPPSFSSFLEAQAVLSDTHFVVHTKLWRCNHISCVRIIGVSDNQRLGNQRSDNRRSTVVTNIVLMAIEIDVILVQFALSPCFFFEIAAFYGIFLLFGVLARSPKFVKNSTNNSKKIVKT